MTLLQILNRLLLKLRQDQVQTVSQSNYTLLLIQLINEAKREIEDAWNWMALRTTVELVTVSGYSQYTLLGVGNSRFKVLEVINDTEDYLLETMTSGEMTRKFLFESASSPTLDKPRFYGFNGFDVNENPIVDLYPIPNGAYNINFNLVLPQNDLSLNEDRPKVPAHLVLAGAYVKALVERGEDNSGGFEIAVTQYSGALASNISQESALMPGETDWYAV